MPAKVRQDLTGQRFGRLTVIGQANVLSRSVIWKVLCDCGTKKLVSQGNLLNGRTNSCGCLNIEKIIERNTKHGKFDTPEYQVWRDMRARCRDKSNWAYKKYGARGITVCNRWDDFQAFFDDMGEKPFQKAVLLRIDTSKGYCPENCKWGKMHSLVRHGKEYTYAGMTMTITEWAEYLELPRKVIAERLKNGWSVERALTTAYGWQHARRSRP
jgi:hypothetical protein